MHEGSTGKHSPAANHTSSTINNRPTVQFALCCFFPAPVGLVILRERVHQDRRPLGLLHRQAQDGA